MCQLRTFIWTYELQVCALRFQRDGGLTVCQLLNFIWTHESYVRYVRLTSNFISYAQLEDQGHTLGIVPNGFSICTPDYGY